MSLVNITIDDFCPSFFQYSPAANWFTGSPDTAQSGISTSTPFLSSFVDQRYHETTFTGASFTLNFTGPSIYLYGLAGPAQGYYTTKLDSQASSAPTSAFAPSNASFLLYQSLQLSSGPHSLLVTNLGNNGNKSVGAALLVDYALLSSVVGSSGSTLKNTTVEDNNRSILKYTGTWDSNNDTRFSGNTSTYSNQDGATVSLNFNGSAVYIFGDTVNDHGTYSVTLDGVSNTYNAYTPFLEFDTLKYFAGNLTATPHVLKITNIGTTFFDIDSIIYTTPSVYFTSPPNAASNSTPASSKSTTSIVQSSPSSNASAAPKSADAVSARRGRWSVGICSLGYLWAVVLFKGL